MLPLIGIVSRVLSFVYYHAGKSTFLRRHAPAALNVASIHTSYASMGESWPRTHINRQVTRNESTESVPCTLYVKLGREQILARETANPFSLLVISRLHATGIACFLPRPKFLRDRMNRRF